MFCSLSNRIIISSNRINSYFKGLLVNLYLNKSDYVIKGIDVPQLYPNKSLGTYFFENANKFSENLFQYDVDTNENETYKDLKNKSVRLAIALQKMGVQPHDILATFSGSHMDYVYPLVSGAYIGAIVTYIDTNLTRQNVKRILRLSTPKIIFVDFARQSLLEVFLKTIEHSCPIVTFGPVPSNFVKKFAHINDLWIETTEEQSFTPFKVDLKSEALLLFPSGSTELVTGVCHSHSSIMNMLIFSKQVIILESHLRYLSLVSFYCLSGLFSLLLSISIGGCRYFAKSFNITKIFETIHNHKLLGMYISTIIRDKLITFPKRNDYDVSSQLCLISSGPLLTIAKREELLNIFPNIVIYNYYFQPETGIVFSFSYPLDKELIEKKQTSVGLVVANVQAKVIDLNTSEILGPDKIGQLYVSTSRQMIDYYKTKKKVVDEDGFLKTDDLAYYDADNCFYLLNRITEVFKYKNFYIIPASIEKLLIEHPKIEDAIVIGVLPKEGESVGLLPTAIIVRKEKITRQEINEFINTKVKTHEQLKGGIFFVQVLPKNRDGFKNRKDIIEQFLKFSKMFRL